MTNTPRHQPTVTLSRHLATVITFLAHSPIGQARHTSTTLSATSSIHSPPNHNRYYTKATPRPNVTAMSSRHRSNVNRMYAPLWRSPTASGPARRGLPAYAARMTLTWPRVVPCRWDGVCLWCAFVLGVSRARVHGDAPYQSEGAWGMNPAPPKRSSKENLQDGRGEGGDAERGDGRALAEMIQPATDAGAADGWVYICWGCGRGF